jgi:hypothetical protein
MKHCDYCGQNSEDKALECRKCGAPLEDWSIGERMLDRWNMLDGTLRAIKMDIDYDAIEKACGVWGAPNRTMPKPTPHSATYDFSTACDMAHAKVAFDKAEIAILLKDSGLASNEWIRANVLT